MSISLLPSLPLSSFSSSSSPIMCSWLEHLQLGQYHQTLEAHGIYSLSQVIDLTEEVTAMICKIVCHSYFLLQKIIILSSGPPTAWYKQRATLSHVSQGSEADPPVHIYWYTSGRGEWGGRDLNVGRCVAFPSSPAYLPVRYLSPPPAPPPFPPTITLNLNVNHNYIVNDCKCKLQGLSTLPTA